jgi:hypothetical protein
LNDLYSDTCNCAALPDLADNADEWDAIYTDIARQLLNGEDLSSDALYNKTAAQLMAALNKGLGGTSFDDEDSRKELQSKFKQNIEQFSYAKTLTQFQLFKDAVFNEKGQIQSLATVKKAVADTGEVFNNNYLRAEHQYVVQTAIMAHKWETMDAQYLEFTTVGDSHVRASHKLFDKFTALKTDPIWKRLYTPLDWGCRCTVIPGVAKNVSKEYDSDWANKVVDPLVKGTIFDNNAALTGKVFTDKHPYFRMNETKVKGLKKPTQQNKIDLAELIKGELPTDKEIKSIFMKYAEIAPEDFRNGLGAIRISSSKGYLMQHSMTYSPYNGEWVGPSTISLSKNTFNKGFNPLEDLRGALGAIKKGSNMTFNQEYSLESLWHEILHAKTKTKPVKLSTFQVQNMETINQFVARHTYDGFIEKLGGKATNKADILDNGYGYNNWVSAFRGELSKRGIPESKAVEFFTPHLMNDYPSIGGKIREFFTEK